MADAKLAAWAKDALKAAAAFESAVSTYNLLAKRSQLRKPQSLIDLYSLKC